MGFGDTQVRLYAEYARPRLIDFLRGSNSYNLELVRFSAVDLFITLKQISRHTTSVKIVT